MKYAIDQPDVPLVFWPKFREVGLQVLDGGSSIALISVCPWCGGKLPDSLRERWFAELEKRGIDPGTDEIPAEFKNSELAPEFR
jgi:hypothetical protein